VREYTLDGLALENLGNLLDDISALLVLKVATTKGTSETV
jgi:hypothetical protein